MPSILSGNPIAAPLISISHLTWPEPNSIVPLAFLRGCYNAVSVYHDNVSELHLRFTVLKGNPEGKKRRSSPIPRVGFALPDETKLLIRIANGQPSTHVLPIEISLNEPISASTRFY